MFNFSTFIISNVIINHFKCFKVYFEVLRFYRLISILKVKEPIKNLTLRQAISAYLLTILIVDFKHCMHHLENSAVTRAPTIHGVEIIEDKGHHHMRNTSYPLATS